MKENNLERFHSIPSYLKPKFWNDPVSINGKDHHPSPFSNKFVSFQFARPRNNFALQLVGFWFEFGTGLQVRLFLQRHRYRYWYTGTGTPALVLVLVHWHCYWHWYTGTGTGTDDFVVLEKILGWVLRLLGTLEVLRLPKHQSWLWSITRPKALSPRLRKEISAERPFAN